MTRHLVLGAAALALSLALPLRGATPELPQGGAALRTPTTPGEILPAFVASLEDFRSGISEEASDLLTLGQAACEQLARCDVMDLAKFYAGLTAEERSRGFAHEEEFRGYWQRVRNANTVGLSAEAWAVERESLLQGLDDLGHRADTLADPSPAARAWSLSCRLGLAELSSGTLSPAAAHDLAMDCRERAERAESHFLRAGYVTPRLEPLWLLARLDKFDGHADAARQAFSEVLALARSVGNADFQLHALSGLSDLARDRGDAHAVDLCLRQMAELRPPSAEGTGFRLALRHAMRLIHQDEPKAALVFLGRHRPAQEASLTAWHLACASAHTRLDELGAALESWAAADELSSASDALISDHWNLDLVRARIEIVAGRYGQALGILDRCAEEAMIENADSAISEEFRLELYAMRGEALLHLARHDAARKELERALALARELNSRFEPDSAGTTEAERMGAFAARANVLGEALGVHRLVLLAEANLLLGNPLRAAHEIERAQSTSLRVGSASQDIDLNAWAESVELGLVTWAVGPDETVVCELARVGRRGQIRAKGRKIPLGRVAIQRAIRRLREAILTGDLERARRLGAEFASALFPTTKQEALRRGRKLYLLHGPLEELPLEWLLAEGLIGERQEGAAPTFSRTIPIVLPGLPAARPGSPDNTPLRWTLLGDPRGADGELLLPGARDEIRTLVDLHPGAVALHGEAFNLPAVQTVLQIPPPGTGALHIATHLATDAALELAKREPTATELSAKRAREWIGGDLGLLCSGLEILQLTDLERAAPHFRLAVLSACATGSGRFIDGEGLHGIAQTLLAGGTRNVVVTLWPVEDRAAQRFSEALHRSLLAGRAPSVAVHEARTTLRDDGLPPADWAAFRLLGRD